MNWIDRQWWVNLAVFKVGDQAGSLIAFRARNRIGAAFVIQPASLLVDEAVRQAVERRVRSELD